MQAIINFGEESPREGGSSARERSVGKMAGSVWVFQGTGSAGAGTPHQVERLTAPALNSLLKQKSFIVVFNPTVK